MTARLTRTEAEMQIFGGCIHHEHALVAALHQLPLEPFRSRDADEMNIAFYLLAGWLSQGTYDPETNEARLIAGARLWCYYPETAEGFLDLCWTPEMAAPEYAGALVADLARANRLDDEALTYPFLRGIPSPVLAPPPPAALAPVKGGLGGIVVD